MTKDAGDIATQTLGWVGAGKMGAPMATNLLEAGFGVTVSEPNPAARAAMAERGAVPVSNLADLAGADIVFCTLPNDAALEAVVLGGGLANILRPGAILVEMSTVSPACSQAVAQALAARDIRYLRAPISGSTAMAQAATLTILASGDQTAWDNVLPLLERMSSRQVFLGPADEARYMKLVLNTLVGATAAVLAEAMAMGKAGGLDAATMMDVIAQSAVASPLLNYKSDAIAKGDFTPAFSVEQMAKDFSLITAAGQAKGVPMETAALILEHYRTASRDGHGARDFFALIDWVEGRAREPAARRA